MQARPYKLPTHDISRLAHELVSSLHGQWRCRHQACTLAHIIPLQGFPPGLFFHQSHRPSAPMGQFPSSLSHQTAYVCACVCDQTPPPRLRTPHVSLSRARRKCGLRREKAPVLWLEIQVGCADSRSDWRQTPLVLGCCTVV